jgi:hypothetical protein
MLRFDDEALTAPGRRRLGSASTDEVAARQKAKAEARLRSGEVLDHETELVRSRERLLAVYGITQP